MAWETPLVMDNGSGICKAGFAGDHAPTVVFPSKVGRPRPSFVNDPDLKLRDSYVGDEAHSNRLLLSVKHPVQQGMITNWDDMEKLWDHTFKELDVFPDEHPILLTDVPNNPEVNREKMAQIMFETFKSPAIYIAIQGVLSLYAYGLVTGVAVDCGAQVSQIVPTIEGFSISNAMGCLDLGGQDLNLYLMKILGENGFTFTMQHCIEDVCEMKEKFCYVALDFDEEIQKTAVVGTTYELPDKQVVTIGSEQFRCPEAFFQPHILGKELDGIHKACYDNITKCDESEEVTKELFGNVVLSGGSSMFSGFPERMQKELASLVPSNTNLNVLAVPNRKHNVWIGGSIIASQSAFKEMWLTKEEYEESGPSIIHKKCV